MIVHTSDLYVPTKAQVVATKWSSLINQEFIQQNKKEKENGLPVTPFYKNLHIMKVMAKSESFFTEKIVGPLWIELDRFVNGSLKKQKENIKKCTQYWKQVLKEEEEKEKAKVENEDDKETSKNTVQSIQIPHLKTPRTIITRDNSAIQEEKSDALIIKPKRLKTEESIGKN